MGNLQRGGRSHIGGEVGLRRDYCIFMGILNTKPNATARPSFLHDKTMKGNVLATWFQRVPKI